MTKKDSSNPMLLHVFHRSRSSKKGGIPYFPQPTRPENVASPKPPCTPPHPPWEFASPSTTGPIQSPSNRSGRPSPATINYLHNIGYPCVPESWFEKHRGEVEEDDEEVSEQGYEETIRQILELYGKLPTKVKEKVSMELIRNIVGHRIDIIGGATTSQVGFTVGYSTPGDRGLNEQASPNRLDWFKVKTVKTGGISTNGDEISPHRLGRFKVKTINAGGISNDDDGDENGPN